MYRLNLVRHNGTALVALDWKFAATVLSTSSELDLIFEVHLNASSKEEVRK
jgi:hypothetical protein